MTLLDYETGKKIINPYVSLYGREKDGTWRTWRALNTETFTPAQEHIIWLPERSETMHTGRVFKSGTRFYKAVATIGKYKIADAGKVIKSGADDAIALIPLGYLLEDHIRELFPKIIASLPSEPTNEKE